MWQNRTVTCILSGLSCKYVLFVCLILYVPVKSFSVMLGWVFLGWTSTKQMVKHLAQGYNAVPPVRLEPTIPWSRALPLRSSWACFKLILESINRVHLNLCSTNEYKSKSTHTANSSKRFWMMYFYCKTFAILVRSLNLINYFSALRGQMSNVGTNSSFIDTSLINTFKQTDQSQIRLLLWSYLIWILSSLLWQEFCGSKHENPIFAKYWKSLKF